MASSISGPTSARTTGVPRGAESRAPDAAARPPSDTLTSPAGLVRRTLVPGGTAAGRARGAALPPRAEALRASTAAGGAAVAPDASATAPQAARTAGAAAARLQDALRQDLSVPAHQVAAHAQALRYGQAAEAALDRALPPHLAGARGGARLAAEVFGAALGARAVSPDTAAAVMDAAVGRRAEALLAQAPPLAPQPFEPVDERAIVPDEMVQLMHALQPSSGLALRQQVRALQHDITDPGSDGNVLAVQVALAGATRSPGGMHRAVTTAAAGELVGATLVLRQAASAIAVPALAALREAAASALADGAGAAVLDRVMAGAAQAPLFLAEPPVAPEVGTATPAQRDQAARAAQGVRQSAAALQVLARMAATAGAAEATGSAEGARARALPLGSEEHGRLQRSAQAAGRSIGAFRALAALPQPLALSVAG